MLSVRIFRSYVVGHECFFKCWAIELVSERCIVSLLDRVVEVKPTYILLLSEIQSPRGTFKFIYNVGFLQHPNRGRGVISNDQIRGFKLIIIYNKFYFFIRISGEYVFVNQCFHYCFIGFIIVVHLVAIKSLIYVCWLDGVVHCLFCWLTFLIIRLICSSTI